MPTASGIEAIKGGTNGKYCRNGKRMETDEIYQTGVRDMPTTRKGASVMPGNKAGGLKAAATNKRIHGSDFYREIGRKGGKNGHTGGFAANPELAREAGRKGGKISRRGPSKNSLRSKAEREIEEYAQKYGDQEEWSEYEAQK